MKLNSSIQSMSLLNRRSFTIAGAAWLTLAFSGSDTRAQTWEGWRSIPDSGTVWHQLQGQPFLTDSGCSAVHDGTALIVAARRAGDHTIWLNSTTDWSLNQWEGWRSVPGGATTAYAPSLAVCKDGAGNKFLVVTAVGLHGPTDPGVYANIYDYRPGHGWAGWVAVPGGAATNAGPAVVVEDWAPQKLRVFVNGTLSGVYENDYNATTKTWWPAWRPLDTALGQYSNPGFRVNGQVCASLVYYGGEPEVLILAPQLSTNQVCYKEDNWYFGWDFWGLLPYRAVTDAALAGPLPGPQPVWDLTYGGATYLGFAKGIGDHRVYGLKQTGYQEIPGGEITDAGLSSTWFVLWWTETPSDWVARSRNVLFAKDQALRTVRFNYFDATQTFSKLH